MDAEKMNNPEIVAVKNKLEARFFQLYWLIIPGIFCARAIVQYIDTRALPFALVDASRILIELGLLLSIFCCNRLFSELPYKLKQLFSSTAFRDSKHNHASEALFYKQLTHRLNHPLHYLVGASTVILMSIYYGATYNPNAAIGGSIWRLFGQILTVPPIIVYSYFVGVLAWKYLVISRSLYCLPDDFQFKVQFGHPDKAGGLLSIGLLSLNLIYIPIIPTLVSASELVLGYLGLLELTKSNYVFLIVLLIYSLIGSLIGLLPVLKFHRVMQSQRDSGMAILNQLAHRILQLKGELFKTSPSLQGEAVESLSSEITAYEAVYHAHQNINTWPINRKVIVEIWATQTFVVGQLLATWNLISQFI